MSNNIVSPSSRQVKSLTQKQRATIDALIANHPALTYHSVNAYYLPSYARSYYVFIDTEPDNKYSGKVIITRCDHKHTAYEKTLAIREYIREKGGQE